MYNFLFCSAGRRVKLIEDFKNTLGENGKIVVADNSIYAPARYVADKEYLVPGIYEETYIDTLLSICEKEEINAIITLIDPEIEILAKNRERFEEKRITLLIPSVKTAHLCFDKYEMYQYLTEHGIKTTLTFDSLEHFRKAFEENKITFPVFVKPRTGSGSVGARKIQNMTELEEAIANDATLIIQEFMNGIDLDADVYVDLISKEAVSIFSKKKIETKIGGASKTISFKDEKLFHTIQNIVKLFEFNGTIDMDFFYKDGEYYLSEVNPRFGGAYLHAYGAGVDFIKLIINNLNHIQNEVCLGDYEEDIMMLMYDDVVIQKLNKT